MSATNLYILKVHQSYTANQLFTTADEALLYANELLHLRSGDFSIFQFQFTGTYLLQEEDGSNVLTCRCEPSLLDLGELFISL